MLSLPSLLVLFIPQLVNNIEHLAVEAVVRSLPFFPSLTQSSLHLSMNSTRSNTTESSLESYEESASVVQMAELALIGVCSALFIICTIFYIITRIMRRKHQKQFRRMETEARDPLKEGTTTQKGNASNHN